MAKTKQQQAGNRGGDGGGGQVRILKNVVAPTRRSFAKGKVVPLDLVKRHRLKAKYYEPVTEQPKD